jgi:HAD superfamily hydrolase (TIGR01509 family)
MPKAVIFDLDGVLVDSEQLWNQAKEEEVRDRGGQWRVDAPHAMMGMSSPEWAAYLHRQLGVAAPPEEINREVVSRIEKLYRARLPLLDGAVDVVRAAAGRWPLGLASSSNREIIDLVLELSGLQDAFAATVSSEEARRGKPAPDVYLEAASRLGVDPQRCVAVEDSGNGLRAAAAAGMTVIAVPNPHYPPDEDALALAAVTVPAIADVTLALLEQAGDQ